MEQYLKYNSVTNIRFAPNVINSLPAITICYNRLYSFEKITKRNSGKDEQDVYGKYINFTNKFNGIYNLEHNFSVNIQKKNQFFLQKYQDLLVNFELNYPGILLSRKYNFYDIFDNLTLPYEDASLLKEFNNDNRSIKINVFGLNYKLPGFYHYYGGDDNLPRTSVYISKPIESIDLNRISKCFTFFDETQIPLSQNLVNLKSINIKVEFPKSWFPFDEKIDISFALHSPNSIPGRHSFDYHRQNTNNNKYFSKIEDIGLENYDNCINCGDIENENNTRNYCLDKCLAGSIGSECLAVYNLKNKQPLRKNQLPNTIFLNSKK